MITFIHAQEGKQITLAIAIVGVFQIVTYCILGTIVRNSVSLLTKIAIKLEIHITYLHSRAIKSTMLSHRWSGNIYR